VQVKICADVSKFEEQQGGQNAGKEKTQMENPTEPG